ncbi:hypothetical protein [Flavobacterium sp. CF136]|uniref:hypothetical protein n=1 Tax=Flavobacterium sp. (strain CF136) TaxID=1144313 RepID=UPI00193098F4|nr:hypothetical protein [Flavobacterium sp. CF136]
MKRIKNGIQLHKSYKLMKTKQLILIIVFTLMNVSCDSQNKETYWEISNIYREDKEDFKGLTGNYMQQILDQNFHFIKKNDSLFFELPEKFTVNINNLKSLIQIKIMDKDYYEMYDFSFSDKTFNIKFKDNATFSSSKNTIIEFSQISKEKFQKDINEEIAYVKELKQKTNNLKTELASKPQIKLNNVVKLPLKNYTIQNDKEGKIVLQIPQQIELKESGDIKNRKFDAIKIGTFKDNSKIYDVEDPKNNYGLRQLTIWVSTDPSNFNIDQYLAQASNLVVLKKDNNSIVGYELGYDNNFEKAIINSFFCLKYYNVNKSHIFIYSDVYQSQTKGANSIEEMNKILNFNYLISENINVKNE